MTAFRLVRAEPSEAMIKAGLVAADGDHSDTVADIPENAYRAMLAASEPPTDAEIDDLCWMYESTHKHGPADHWERDETGVWASVAPLHERRRNEDRTRFRAFLTALSKEPTS